MKKTKFAKLKESLCENMMVILVFSIQQLVNFIMFIEKPGSLNNKTRKAIRFSISSRNQIKIYDT